MNSTRVWADIDLDALTHNLATLRRWVGAETRVMLVVKADAYGHGAVAVSHHAVRCGIQALGVGTSSEALELRSAGIRVPILILGTVLEDEVRACLRSAVHIGLHTRDRLEALQCTARAMGRVAHVHLNVDTGMGRLGVPPSVGLDLVGRVHAASHLELAGVMTHMSSPEGARDTFTGLQKQRFDAFLEGARAAGFELGRVHAANSACVATKLEGPYDTVRPGIAALGALPSHLPGATELRPVLSLRSQVVFLKDIGPQTPISYGGTWVSDRQTRIATLAIGYDDGVPWRLSDVGDVLIRGRRAPIVGRVTMDYTTVDVGDVPGVEVGDVATLVGRQGLEEITLEEVAHLAQTIPYEVVCSVGRRVERVYRGAEDPTVSWDIPRSTPETGRPPTASRKREIARKAQQSTESSDQDPISGASPPAPPTIGR